MSWMSDAWRGRCVGNALETAGIMAARRHIQAAVDRQFNRRRHDAAGTIAAFNNRLRDQVDLEALTGELLAVVEPTMQPTPTSLWLRPQPPPGSAAASMARQRT